VLIAVGLQDLPERLVVPEVSAIVLTRVEDRGPAGDVPAVAGVDIDLFREGDLVEVDGTAGDVVLPGVRETHVVTAFVARDDGRILLLRRSEKVGSFQGHWAAVSGYLEDPTPRQQALREVHEETGLSPDDVSVEREGVPVYARGGDQIFVVHPFLLRTRREEVRIDWEHTEFEWVTPAEIGRRPTVPKLDRAWTAVAPRPPGRRKG
jgi:8-oxo-dGTP pyrophosphatase MutT (NUDIX family)